MPKMFLVDGDTLLLERLNRFCNVYRVPQNNCCNHQIQCTGAMALILVGAVSDLTQSVKTDGTRE